MGNRDTMGFNRGGIRDPTRLPEKRWPLISRRRAQRLQRVGRVPRENLFREILEIMIKSSPIEGERNVIEGKFHGSIFFQRENR